MAKYSLHPCDKCGRKISRGYDVTRYTQAFNYVCGRCYKTVAGGGWLDSVIKIHNETEVNNALLP